MQSNVAESSGKWLSRHTESHIQSYINITTNLHIPIFLSHLVLFCMYLFASYMHSVSIYVKSTGAEFFSLKFNVLISKS